MAWQVPHYNRVVVCMRLGDWDLETSPVSWWWRGALDYFLVIGDFNIFDNESLENRLSGEWFGDHCLGGGGGGGGV